MALVIHWEPSPPTLEQPSRQWPNVDRRSSVVRLTAAELVANARRHVESLAPSEVVGAWQAGALLVDVREEDELRVEGWIRDSVWAPRGMLEFWADPTDHRHRAEFAPERRLILFCSTGERSAIAAAALRTLGYRDVAHLEGGIRAWKQEGRTVELP